MATKKKVLKRSKSTGPKTPLALWNLFDQLRFKKTPESEKMTEVLKEDLHMPKRATIHNALQDEFRFIDKETGYEVIIQTASINGKMNPKGVSSIQIVDLATKKKLLYREFYKIKFSTVAKRLAIYATVWKNITVNRIPGMDLKEISVTQYAWETKRGKKLLPFDIKNYLFGLNGEDKKFFLQRESNRNSYLNRTEPLVQKGKMTRQRTIQKTWKSKNK